MKAEVLIDGKKIGVLNPANVEVEREYGHLSNGNNIHIYRYLKSQCFVAKLENVIFDPEFHKVHTPEKRYKLVGTGWKLPKGKKLPKKKRLLKKYKKKYSYTIEMDNVFIK